MKIEKAKHCIIYNDIVMTSLQSCWTGNMQHLEHEPLRDKLHKMLW